MGDRPQSANQRRLEQLRAMRDEAMPAPTAEDVIEALQSRVGELEAEVARLRELLSATRPKPEQQPADEAGSSRPNRSRP